MSQARPLYWQESVRRPPHPIGSPWHGWHVEHLLPTEMEIDVGGANSAHTVITGARRRPTCDFDDHARRLAIAGPNARARGVATAHPFAWDVTGLFAFGGGIIDHLRRRVAVSREKHRARRPGGRLLVSGPSSDCSGRRGLRAAGLSAYSDPDHKIEYRREASCDSPWAALVDAPGGLSLALYASLSRWKRGAALRDPEESRGFQVLARRRP